MIDSGLFTKSIAAISRQSQIPTEELDISANSCTINKITMFHLINAHIFQIFNDEGMDLMLKKKFIEEFAFKLGYNLVEEQCLGFLKYSANKSDKNDSKQFVGEMKLLNSRVWHCLVGSKGKLFSISDAALTSSSYKIEDKEFTLGKPFVNSTDEAQKTIRNLLIEFCQGFIMGSFEKLGLEGEIRCAQGTEGSVYAELKNLVRKSEQNKFKEYCDNLESTP